MRRLSILLAGLFFASPTLAQRTVVSGTVVDPAGIPYSGATMVATLSLPVGAGGATLNGVQVAGTTQRVTFDSAGSFLIQLPDNAVVLPGGTQWTFTVTMSPGVPRPLGTGPQTFSATITITGASQSISTQLNAAAPLLAIIPSALQPQVLSNVAFSGGTMPRNISGTVLLQLTPTAFTLTGSPCNPACDGQRLTFFAFAIGSYTISGTLGQTIFTAPTMGAADKITLPGVGTSATFEYRNGTLFYIGGNGFIPSFNGVAGPPVGSSPNDFFQNVSANGPLDLTGPIAPFGSAFITKGSAAVLTLTNPVAGTDDGKTLTVFSTTAFAHTITTGAAGINGSLHIATFGAAVANFIILKAFNGSWWVIGNTGVTLT